MLENAYKLYTWLEQGACLQVCGEARATAVLTATVQPGQLFMPMHFEAVNRLTFPSFDPHSRQPSYKACAVRLSLAASVNQSP